MSTSQPKILIIDDNLKIQEILTKFLGQHQLQVLNAYSGRQGLELARTKAPDLILLDLILPGEDSLAVLKNLNLDPATRSLPKIVLTNDDSKDQLEAVQRQKVARFMVKAHYQLKDILAEIKEVLAESQAQAQTQAPPATPPPAAESKSLILMLNDDEFLLDIFKNLFERKGFPFKGVSSIPSTGLLKFITSFEPSLIIIDLVMCFDGIKVLKTIKDSNLKEIPVVILDNAFNEGEIERAREAGVDAYIPMKQNNPRQAVKKIIRLLEA